jgi:SAM-dependent methyltransferase
MKLSQRFCLAALTLLLCASCSLSRKPLPASSDEKYTEQDALGMIKASRGTLAPVYAPLAEQIVADFNLAEKTGIGIDLGSGPGTLIIELCKRTRLHWINADINPHFFPYFHSQAKKCGLGHRVSAIFADAHWLPFRDDYADIIVSRGSFHFWKDKVQAFSEIYRVLKPGAVAYIGRGFSKNLPVETAHKIRAKQGGKMKYDVEETANELRNIMNELGIKDYHIHRPQPPGSERVSYGIWVEFRKPKANVAAAG